MKMKRNIGSIILLGNPYGEVKEIENDAGNRKTYSQRIHDG
jgi:hypothetical protein